MHLLIEAWLSCVRMNMALYTSFLTSGVAMADKAYLVECSSFELIRAIKSYLNQNQIGWSDLGIGPCSLYSQRKKSVIRLNTSPISLKHLWELQGLCDRHPKPITTLIVESREQATS